MFSRPYWIEINKELERRFVPLPPIEFLRDDLIAGSMFVNRRGSLLAAQLSYLERRLRARRLRKLLIEDYVGRPPLLPRYRTSHNTVHHLYHLEQYREQTSIDPASLDVVVEWGGGYGNLAKLFRRASEQPRTYVIVDNPFFSAVQWLYLITVLGEGSVQLVTSDQGHLEEGKINLLPTGALDVLAHTRADLFVSTWALSETTAVAQNYVADRAWFGARHFLLAYQDSSESFPEAARIGEVAKANGASIHELSVLPGNYYAFA